MRESGLIGADLAKPLSKANIKPAKQFGPKGDYIEGWHAIAEANRIFGWDGWSYTVIDRALVSERPREIGKAERAKPGWGVSYIARVRVTVGDVVREDEGAGHGYDVDCGLAHESASKEAVTDALKRALRTFGNPFGLALYDKERAGVEVGDPAPPPMPAPPPAAATDDARLASLVSNLDLARDMAELREIWGQYSRDPIASAPAAIRAKDRNKARLTAPADVFPGDTVNADPVVLGEHRVA